MLLPAKPQGVLGDQCSCIGCGPRHLQTTGSAYRPLFSALRTPILKEAGGPQHPLARAVWVQSMPSVCACCLLQVCLLLSTPELCLSEGSSPRGFPRHLLMGGHHTLGLLLLILLLLRAFQQVHAHNCSACCRNLRRRARAHSFFRKQVPAPLLCCSMRAGGLASSSAQSFAASALFLAMHQKGNTHTLQVLRRRRRLHWRVWVHTSSRALAQLLLLLVTVLFCDTPHTHTHAAAVLVAASRRPCRIVVHFCAAGLRSSSVVSLIRVQRPAPAS